MKDAKPTGHLAAKVLLSGSLILATGAYGWWQREVPPAAGAPAGSPLHRARPATKPMNLAALAPPRVATIDARAPEVPVAPAASSEAPPEAAVQRAVQDPAPVAPAAQPAAVPAPLAPEAAAASPAAIASASATPAQPAPPPAKPGARYADGDFVGSATDTVWGAVQVQASIRNGAITDVECLDYPAHRRRSVQINGWALPILANEVIQAQSANVDIVTQATATSVGYLQSLSTALEQSRKPS